MESPLPSSTSLRHFATFLPTGSINNWLTESSALVVGVPDTLIFESRPQCMHQFAGTCSSWP
jgi:hypothetical protein